MTDKASGATPAPPAARRIERDKPLFRKVRLDFPIEFDGKVYEEIEVRRMTGEQVRQFVEASGKDGEAPRLPMFDCPLEVIEALDADDDRRLNEAVMDFLPQALRRASEPTSDTGEPTSQSRP